MAEHPRLIGRQMFGMPTGITNDHSEELTMDVNGKKVIVVGGASGMGRATAELLAQRGACVAILDRENSNGAPVAAGVDASFPAVDATGLAGTEQALDTAVDELGGLHVVVTTAGGGFGKRTPSNDGPRDLESFRATMDLNIMATFNISRLAAAHMSQNEPEDENAASSSAPPPLAAFEGQIGQAAYTAAKAAIAGCA